MEATNGIQDRILILINELNESQNGFAKKIGVSSSVINQIVTGNSTNTGKRNKPSSDLIEKIATALPKLNLEWLITGNGSIWKEIRPVETGKMGFDFFEKLTQELKNLQNLILEKDKKELFYIETITNLSKH